MAASIDVYMVSSTENKSENVTLKPKDAAAILENLKEGRRLLRKCSMPCFPRLFLQQSY